MLCFIFSALWWMFVFVFRLTGDGKNLRRQLDCSQPLIFIPPTLRTPAIIIQNIWKFVYELCSGCFYNPPASFTFLPFDLNNFCRPNQVFICLFCRLRKNNKGRSIQKSRRKTKLNKASGKNVNIKMNQITDQNCDDRTVSHFCDVFASFPVICLDILYKLDFFVWHYLH